MRVAKGVPLQPVHGRGPITLHIGREVYDGVLCSKMRPETGHFMRQVPMALEVPDETLANETLNKLGVYAFLPSSVPNSLVGCSTIWRDMETPRNGTLTDHWIVCDGILRLGDRRPCCVGFENVSEKKSYPPVCLVRRVTLMSAFFRGRRRVLVAVTYTYVQMEMLVSMCRRFL